MTPSLFLLFNHHFTAAQEADARTSLGVNRIITLPADLQALWSNMPPDLDGIDGYLESIKAWLQAGSEPGDYVLIQGDFGATYIMVGFALRNLLKPLYSTSLREAGEERRPDGSIILTHHFRHRRFRHYGR